MEDFSKDDQINYWEKVTQIKCIGILSLVKQTKEIILQKSNYDTSGKHNA